MGGARAQAAQHRVNVVVVRQGGEVGAQDEVDGVVGPAVVEQFGARCDQPYRRRGRLSGGAESDLALAVQPGVGIDGVVCCGRLGESEVFSAPATSAA